MEDDNTIEDFAPEDTEEIESVEEDTDVEVPEVFSFAGREFPSQVEAEKTYKEMQKTATQKTQELKKIEAQIKAEKLKAEFQSLDPDEKMDKLAELMLQKEELEDEVEEVEEALEDDTPEVQAYIKRHPVLSEYPALAEQFLDLATTKFKGYTLDSLYDSRFKPLIDSIAGKKVTVKKKVVSGSTQLSELTEEAISKMSPAEYEKNREAILKFLTK
jgi:hypothetical protein